MNKMKRVLAVLLIILLLSLYIWSVVSAFFVTPESDTMFQAALICTFAFPVLIYAYMMSAKWFKKRKDN